MAIPSPPTVAGIVEEGLKLSGRVQPTVTQIQNATTYQFQAIKSDIMRKARTHPQLRATATTVTTKGQSRYPLPLDYNEFISAKALDGPDNYRGTVQAGGVQSVTFPSSIVLADEVEALGRYVLITSGNGANQMRQITSYNTGTRVAGLDSPWSVEPNAASTFLIVTENEPMLKLDAPVEYDPLATDFALDVPRSFAITDNEIVVYPTPLKSSFGIQLRYYVDLGSLDEASLMFTELLRDWMSVFLQGIAVKCGQRYDEDRYATEFQIYNDMLNELEQQALKVVPMKPNGLT